MPDLLTASGLHDLLRRWVADGLIDAGQADRIEAAEAVRGAPAGPPGAAGALRGPGQRRGLVVEALGTWAARLHGGRVHRRGPALAAIPTSAELAFAAGGTVALLGAGAAIRIDGNPPLRRLRSVLWLMSTASLAAFMGVLAAQVWDLGGIA